MAMAVQADVREAAAVENMIEVLPAPQSGFMIQGI